ncbi:MAG: tetratricopeptide repeat protein [Spartobacteria bacterium]
MKFRPNTLRSISPALGVFLGVFVLRLFVLERLTESQFLLPTGGDMHFYNEWALRILRGRWSEQTAFYGLPLYAYLLAGIYKLCGYNPFVPGFLQAGLEGGTAVLIYQLGIRVFASEETGRRGQIIGLSAAFGWAFFQPAQAYSVILMPTVWLVIVFWFVVWDIVRRRAAPPLPVCLLLGVLIGFTAMGIATILFLFPLVVAAFFLRWKAVLSSQWARLALFAVGIFLGASPAALHNYFIARDPVFLSAHGGVNFWIGNNPQANGYPRFPPGLRAGQKAMLKDSIDTAERAAGHPLKRSEVSAYWSQKARAWIKQNPGAWLQLLGIKIGNFWNAFQYDDLSIIDTLRAEGVIFPGIRFGIVAALALPGLFLTWRKFPLSRWMAAAVLLHLFSLMGVFVTERYRLAAVPGLLLFAAAGLWEFWHAGANAHYRRAVFYLGLLALSTWFVSLPQRAPSLWALESYNSGLRALQSKNLAAAEEKLDLAYAYVPKNAELNFALGNLRLAQGNKVAAKQFYLTVLQLDPRHQGSYNNLGVLAFDENRWSLAADFFAKALEEDEHNAKTLYLLAKAHFRAGDLAAARGEIAQAIKLSPTQPEFIALREEMERKVKAPPQE